MIPSPLCFLWNSLACLSVFSKPWNVGSWLQYCPCAWSLTDNSLFSLKRWSWKVSFNLKHTCSLDSQNRSTSANKNWDVIVPLKHPVLLARRGVIFKGNYMMLLSSECAKAFLLRWMFCVKATDTEDVATQKFATVQERSNSTTICNNSELIQVGLRCHYQQAFFFFLGMCHVCYSDKNEIYMLFLSVTLSNCLY